MATSPITVTISNSAEMKNRSDFKSSAWKSQESAWKFTYDWWQSPMYLRDKGTEYLEKFRKEPDLKYQERLGRSVPTNKFRETIETFAGMVFKQDPCPRGHTEKHGDTEITVAPPKPIADLFTDIDNCGNSLHSFLIEAFELYLRDGNAHIYVDCPPAPMTEEGQQLTAADRAADRPFWVLYSASQLINHRYEAINGRDVLTLAVLEEKTLEPDGEYGEKEVIRHRILKRGEYKVEIQNEKKEWVADPDNPGGVTGLDEIPLVSIAEIGTAPMLLVLAMLNHQYYNKLSDFDSWCHIACVPRQVLKFDNAEDAKQYKEVSQSVETGLKIYGENADAKYLEVTGAGLEVAKARCEDIKAEMAAIGVGLLAPSYIGGDKSATEVLDTAGQRQSKLARYARDFENAIEKAFYYTGLQENVIRPGSVNMSDAEKQALKLVMDFDRLTFDAEKIGVFERMNAAGRLSNLTFWEMLTIMGMEMPGGWSAEIEAERLAKQKAAEPKPEPIPDKTPMEREEMVN